MELRPHDPADGLTMLTGAAYRPDAQAPTWRAFLERILGPTPSSRRSSAGSPGVSAIGAVREHILAILWGAGANGKTTAANALAFALGDYAHAGTVELLLGRHRPGAATPDIADLRGRRLVTVAETREDGKLAAERVKALTGGDPITARHLYGAAVHLPAVAHDLAPDEPPAARRRRRRRNLAQAPARPVHRHHPQHERDPELGHRLELEADGILAWIVQGAAEYLADGLNPPPAVRAATDEYRQAEDAFAAWLDECTELDPSAFTPTARLRASYAEWAKRNGSEELTSNAITERLSRRPLPASRSPAATGRAAGRESVSLEGPKGDAVTRVTPSWTSSHVRARARKVCNPLSPPSPRHLLEASS